MINTLLKVLFNTYVKSIASVVYLIIAIISFFLLNKIYKVDETHVYEFDYSIIVNSISEYQKLNFGPITNHNLYGLVENHHKDFIDRNDLKIKLKSSIKSVMKEEIYKDKFQLSAKNNNFSDELFETYLISLEKNIEEVLLNKYQKILELNNISANQFKHFFYNFINNLDKEELINENVSLRFQAPLLIGNLSIEYGSDKFGRDSETEFKTEFDQLEFVDEDLTFPISFKTMNDTYNSKYYVISNDDTKYKIYLSILIIIGLLIIFHPILSLRFNEFLIKNR